MLSDSPTAWQIAPMNFPAACVLINDHFTKESVDKRKGLCYNIQR